MTTGYQIPFDFTAQPEIVFPAPAVRHNALDTSREAAQIVTVVASADRLLVLRTLAQVDNLTDHELAAQQGRLQNSLGARRKELRDAGLVEAATELINGEPVTIKRQTRPGSTTKATAWRITAAGRSYLKEHDHA